jgi:hypothetical protein
MSELPKTVKINAIEYKVSVREADYKLGHCDYTNCEIVIHSKQNDARKAKVLVHEILHGALYEAGLESMNTEDTVTKLEGVLYDILKNNDFSWLSSPDRKSGKRGAARPK